MAQKRKQFHKGIKLKPTADAVTEEGEITYDSGANKLKYYDDAGVEILASEQFVTDALDAEDLSFRGDTGGDFTVDHSTEVLDIAGGTGIDTVSSSGGTPTVTVDIDVAVSADVTAGTAAKMVDAAEYKKLAVDASGLSAGDTNLGTFTGATITDSNTIKGALQELETAHEEVDANANDLITLSGVAEQATDLGAFTGAVISATPTIKVALQDLETEMELKVTGPAGAITDNAIPKFDTTTGELIQESGIIIADTTDAVSDIGNITFKNDGDKTVKTADEAATDSLDIKSGDASGGDSGNVSLQTGTATGDKGYVEIQGQRHYVETFSSSNATPTLRLSILTASDSVNFVSATLVGQQDDGTETAAHEHKKLIKNDGNVVSTVSGGQELDISEATTALLVAGNDTGDFIDFTVTGVAAETWNWKLHVILTQD